MARALVNVPKAARKGEIVEIKAMTAHPMETGYRSDAKGGTVPRNIVRRFACTYDGEEVFAADFHPAVAANPFITFCTVATVSGSLTFTWTDDAGEVTTATADLTVEG